MNPVFTRPFIWVLNLIGALIVGDFVYQAFTTAKVTGGSNILEEILFYRTSQGDHVLTYVLIGIALVVYCIKLYPKDKLFMWHAFGFFLFVVGMGNFFADLFATHMITDIMGDFQQGWLYPLMGLAIFIFNDIPPSLKRLATFVGVILIPYLVWYFASIPVDFYYTAVNQGNKFVQTAYWLVPWVSVWEVGVWTFNLVAFYYLVLRPALKAKPNVKN